MENKAILDLLMAIPEDCNNISIQGVSLQHIDSKKAEQLMETDPDDLLYHQCTLSSGTFLFTSENGKLLSLYRVSEK